MIYQLQEVMIDQFYWNHSTTIWIYQQLIIIRLSFILNGPTNTTSIMINCFVQWIQKEYHLINTLILAVTSRILHVIKWEKQVAHKIKQDWSLELQTNGQVI